MQALGETLKANMENMQNSSPDGITCDKCKTFVPAIYALGKSIQPRCTCEVEEWEQERKEMEERDKKRRIERLFDNSRLGRRFMECKFENWKHRPELEEAFNSAKSFAMNLDSHIKNGISILFFGPPGTGKSHLAAAIVHEALAARMSAVFQNVPALLMRIKATFNNGSSERESEITNALTSANILVLDDLGAEKWSEWTEAILYTIIDERYRQMLPTIVTTNCSLKELETQIGKRTMDRLLEICELKEVNTESYRRIVARKRLGR